MSLRDEFGDIDIYLFDQLLKGRIEPSMAVLDAGCGGGRNLVWLLRQGCAVSGVDESEIAIERIRELARRLAPGLPAESFQVAPVTALPFEDGRFDAVLCNAVLHFARDDNHFVSMVDELWRVLARGGVLFVRLATTISVEQRVTLMRKRWYALPDGTERFLVDEATLLAQTERLGGRLLDPLKTTNVQNLRAMTTWVVGKSPSHAAS
jgi:SAM-dependent methyltransferase